MPVKYHVESNEAAKISYVLDQDRETYCMTDGADHRAKADKICAMLNVTERAIVMLTTVPAIEVPREIKTTVLIHADPKKTPTIQCQTDIGESVRSEVKFVGYGSSAEMVVQEFPLPGPRDIANG